jgi:hypothetical protein
MSKNVATRTKIGAHSAPEQLSLLASVSVPLQFRLDERTRRTGLQQIALIRAQLAAQAAQRHGSAPVRPQRQLAA